MASFYDYLGEVQQETEYGEKAGLTELFFDVKDEEDHFAGLERMYEKNIEDAGYNVKDYLAGREMTGAAPQGLAALGAKLGKGKWATGIAQMHPLGQLALLAGLGFAGKRLFGKKKPKVKQVDFTEGPEGQEGRFLSEARKDRTMDQETSTRFINKALKGSKTADFLGSVSTAAMLLTLTGGKDFWDFGDAETPILDRLFNRGGDTSLMNKSLQYYQPHYPGRPGVPGG